MDEIQIIKVTEGEGEDYYLASHPELPGCLADGKNKAEALLNFKDAYEDYKNALIGFGMTVKELDFSK